MYPTEMSSKAPHAAWTEVHPALGISPMDHLYNQLSGIFMDRWSRNFQNQTAVENWRQSWSAGFADEGITFDEIRRGIAAMRKAKYTPSLGEFMSACRPALDYEAAYHEAVHQMQIRHKPVVRDGHRVTLDKWSHPAIFWAAAHIGTDFSTLTYSQIKGRWKQALDSELQRSRGDVPPFREALPAPCKATISPEEAQRHVAGLRELLGKSRAPKGAVYLSDKNLEQRKRSVQEQIRKAEQAGGEV